MKGNTKNIILKSGAEIIHLKGFNHTGIQEILNRAGVPKGSFYNYFKSKEDFGLQVIDFYIEQFSLMIKKFLDDGSLSPLEKIKGILDRFLEFFKSRDYAYGCPIGNLSQEMGDLSPAFRKKLNEALDRITVGYAGILSEAQKAGEISDQIDVKETANFIVSSWHGALIRMKVVQNLEPLENHFKFIFDYVLKS